MLDGLFISRIVLGCFMWNLRQNFHKFKLIIRFIRTHRERKNIAALSQLTTEELQLENLLPLDVWESACGVLAVRLCHLVAQTKRRTCIQRKFKKKKRYSVVYARTNVIGSRTPFVIASVRSRMH